MRHGSRLVIAAWLALAACAPVPPAQVQTVAKKPPPRTLSAASLSGTARAPVALAGAQSVKNGVLVGTAGRVISNDGASLITNDGGGVISNDGNSLITNDGAGLRLLTAEDLAELPLANAVAIARDARTLKQLTYVKPAATDAQGRFVLKGLPAGVTVLVEILFVGQGGKALRVTSLAHVEAGAQTLAVGLASTLATAALTKAQTEGQIYLIKQAAIEETVQAMAGAMAKDEAHHAEAAAALAVPVDAKGAMVVAVEAPVAPLAPMAAQADALASTDAAVAKQVTQQLDAMKTQLGEDQQQLVTAVTESTQAGSLPSPPPLASDGPPATPTPGVPTAKPTVAATPAPTATAAVMPTPMPTMTVFQPTPAPTFTPNVAVAVSVDAAPQILGLSPLGAAQGTLVTLTCANAGKRTGSVRIQAGATTIDTPPITWTDTLVTFYVTGTMTSGNNFLQGNMVPLSATIVTADGLTSGPAAFNGLR